MAISLALSEMSKVLKPIISHHMHKDIDNLGGKIDRVYWVLLATVGAVAFQLIDKFLF